MIIAGVDEVGVGCLAGPVVASCVILPEEINEIFKDSKSTSESLRSKQFQFLRRNTYASIGLCTPQEIDEMNILRATNLSMIRSYDKFKKTKNLIKIDGLKTFSLNEKTTFIKNGDQKSISIAAASIIAKTWRDRLMTLYSKIYPMYGWERNKGYGTHEHRNAIKKFGLTKIHRKSFLRNLI